MVQLLVRWSFIFTLTVLTGAQAWAACGGTLRTWDAGAGTNQWGTANNWDPNNFPNTTAEDVLVVSASRPTNMNSTVSIGCLEIQSGRLQSRAAATTITITGDYFRNHTLNLLEITSGHNHTFVMGGSADQTFENVDPINTLTISNPNTVTFTHPFNIRNALNLTGASTYLRIDADLTLEAGSTALSVPAGRTVEISSGVTLTALEGITVAGTLKIQDGATLIIGNGKTLQVNSGGILQLNGTSGNVSTLRGNGAGNSFALNVAGQINASYFRIDRLNAAGVNVTGTIQSMNNGEFHFLANAGYAITLGAAASLPSSMTAIGFFDDDAHGNVQSFNASAYNLTDLTLNDWSGSVGGEAGDNDPNDKIDWGSQAGTMLSLSDNTASGFPPATIAEGSADTLFATFAFSLNQASAATDITQVILTMSGTATTSDISTVKVFKDVGAANCVYNAGTDTQIGGNLTLSGSPPTATVTIPPGDVQTESDTDNACFHVLVSTTSSAQDGKTIKFAISGTSDVTNSEGYDFSPTAGPPVTAGESTITSSVITNIWQGDVDDRWDRANNWLNNGQPSSTKDCIIGSGLNVTRVGNVATVACRNATFDNGGTLNYNNTTNTVENYGSLDVKSGFTFQNAATGVISLRGANNQSLKIESAFPGNLVVNNTGAANNDVISVDADSQINGTLTLTNGTLKVTDGRTLTVLGNITVQTGAALEIEPGGILTMANGRTLTVDSGGTLKMVGTAAKTSRVTSTGTSAAYSVVVNGTIEARYFTFDRLNTGGVTINSGATIDTTNHLQDCTFSYPVNDNTTLLTLNRKVPTDSMDGCSFNLDGAGTTGHTSIDVSGIGTGPQTTLSLNTYSGDLAGPGTHTDGANYIVDWQGATNTIDLTQEATGPTSVNAGSSYNMGRFGFQQTQAGASFDNADITSLKLTLTGTGSASDISEVRIFYDADCDSASGTLIGSGTFSGSPASKTFSIGAGQATVEADITTPPKRCIYVEYSIASGASDGKTVGVRIAGATDVVNDQSYAISASTPPPVSLGSAASIVGSSSTIWTGNTNTDWFTAANWSSGLPSSTKDCQVDDVVNDPVINGASGTAVCKSLTIGNGTVTLQNGTGAVLEIHGSYTNTGTLVQNNGTLRLAGTANQTITSTPAIAALTFNKTGGGLVQLGGATTTINTLTIPGGSSFELRVTSGKTLVLPNGLSWTSATFDIKGGGVLQIGNGQSIAVSGGTFRISGTNDVYPQSTSNKGQITVQGGSGSWGFSATAGTVSLTGFLIDRINTSGIQIGGTSDLFAFDGGQFTNLADNPSTRALQLNTSATITETTAVNIGWNWGAANSTHASSCCAPDPSDTYFLVHASACGGNTLTFDQWYGDFWPGSPDDLDTEDKIHDQDDGGPTCQVSIAAAASPVALTSFTATGYDGAVSLDWVTGSENNHAGFNVYRSTSLAGGYIQVNSELIRNFNNATVFQGRYRYVDENVENGRTYYYYIEDVAFNGTTVLHGPVFAIPNAIAGNLPGSEPETNEGGSDSGTDNGNDPVIGPIATPDLIDLGNGVHILAQTKNSLRIEVIPPPAAYAVSAWDAAYRSVSIPGYSATTAEGHPELVERTLMIEVDEVPTTAVLTQQTVLENTVVTHLLQPAPNWVPNGAGVLVASYSPNAAVYAQNQTAPSAYFELTPQIQNIGGRNYVKVKILPLRYNPVIQEVKSLQKLVLDIGLDGQAWEIQPPAQELAASPSAVAGALRIRYKRAGMYELTYDEIAAAGLIGPLSGADTGEFRLYIQGQEAALEIVSGSGLFSSGDRIRFYAPFQRPVEDDENEAVLLTFDLKNSGSALRIEALDADPSGYAEADYLAGFRRVVAEQDNDAILDRPYGDLIDRFVWKFLFTPQGAAPNAASNLDFNVTLPSLLSDAGHIVRVKVRARGKGAFAVNPTHHLGLYVNKVPFMVASRSFDENDRPVTVTMDVPAHYFKPGTNFIRVQALGDLVPAGDYDLVNVDRVEFEYDAYHEAVNDSVTIEKLQLGRAVTVNGFSHADILAYDVSNPDRATRLENLAVSSPDAGATQSARFAVLEGASGELGFRIQILADDAFAKPSALLMGRGYSEPLRSAANGADLIMIGHEPLLRAAERLISHREAQGLRVRTVGIKQVYEEFSHGVKSSQAIRDFLAFAHKQWQKPRPKYVLILGDATYDPRDRFGYEIGAEMMPIPYERGQFMDFGNDNWFVTKNGSSLPFMAIGRLPSDSPGLIASYVDKLIAYENGERAPNKTQSRKMAYVSDSSPLGEKFATQSQQLAVAMKGLKPGVKTSLIDRDQAGSDAAMKAQIQNQFNNPPLMITYLGHGAEDRWADNTVFGLSDVRDLTNEKLPIVVALNCLNGYFFDADPEYKGLGEELIFNPQGGAVAFWGSTAMTPPTVQVALQQAWQAELSKATGQHQNKHRLGDLMLTSKIALGESSGTKDTVRSWTLLGDPAMKLADAAYADAPPAIDGAPEPSIPPETSSPAASDGGGKDKGGFLGCGQVKPPGGGSGRGLAEVLFFALILVAVRRTLKREAFH